MERMSKRAVVFNETGLLVRAACHGEIWRGELLNDRGEVEDEFAYTRESFPGAVIGALRVRDIAFGPRLARRLWLHTEELPAGEPPTRT